MTDFTPIALALALAMHASAKGDQGAVDTQLARIHQLTAPEDLYDKYSSPCVVGYATIYNWYLENRPGEITDVSTQFAVDGKVLTKICEARNLPVKPVLPPAALDHNLHITRINSYPIELLDEWFNGK